MRLKQLALRYFIILGENYSYYLFKRRLSNVNLLSSLSIIEAKYAAWVDTFSAIGNISSELNDDYLYIFSYRRTLMEPHSGILFFYLSLCALLENKGKKSVLLVEGTSTSHIQISDYFAIHEMKFEPMFTKTLFFPSVGHHAWFRNVAKYLSDLITPNNLILVAPNADLEYIALLAPEGKNFKKIVTLHTDWITDTRKSNLYRRIRKLVAIDPFQQIVTCDIEFVANSNAHLKNILENVTWTLEKSNLHVIYHVPTLPESVRMSKEKTILFIGKFDSRKDPVTLTQAWKKIAWKHPEWKLLLIGTNGNQTKKLLKNKSNIQNLEILMNASEEIKRHKLAESAILVIPSLYESFGYPIVEGMMNNCFIIYRSISSLVEIAELYERSGKFSTREELTDCLDFAINTLNRFEPEMAKQHDLINYQKFIADWLNLLSLPS